MSPLYIIITLVLVGLVLMALEVYVPGFILGSIGVILISRYAGDVHLDVDAVLLGELAFAPFNRLTVLGRDIGPKGLYLMGGILLLNLLLILVFYKELKLATFDAGLAGALGFSPAVIHYGLMTAVSITAVGAFDAVGSILVVALMIAPPATAYLITDRLSSMLVLSSLIGGISAVSGYWAAHALDVSIAGSMAAFSSSCIARAAAYVRCRPAATCVAIRPILCCVSWNSAMGAPNCCRSWA